MQSFIVQPPKTLQFVHYLDRVLRQMKTFVLSTMATFISESSPNLEASYSGTRFACDIDQLTDILGPI